MSYILDALQKSVAEANPEVAAGMMRNAQPERKHRFIEGLIVLALIANVIVLSWLFWPEPESAAGDVRKPDIRATTSIPETKRNTVVDRAEPASSTVPPPVITPTPRLSTVTVAEPETVPVEATPAPRTLLTVGDLPVSARQAFPNLEFSTHVYAPDPTLRAIVANGQRLTEGDRIEGLELVEITEEGVIFRYQRYLVAISILALWEDA